MRIVQQDDVRGIRPEQLKGFFVGWPSPPDPERHLEILERSSYVCIAIDASTDQVVGFITAISDGLLAAYVPLLEVLPAHQGYGIGRALVERMMQRLSHLYMVDLVCDEPLVGFYQRLGLTRFVAMGRRNYERQSAR